MTREIKKSIGWGVSGGAGLFLFYFLILTLAQSFAHFTEQFQLLWYWILALILGFSIQAGLYAFIHFWLREIKIKTAGREMAGAGGLSLGSMIACCAHHLADVLPVLGISAVFLFLARYQLFFIFIGIAANIFGIVFMLEIIKKHSLFQEKGVLARLAKFNLGKLKKGVIVVSVAVFSVYFFSLQKEDISKRDIANPAVFKTPVSLSGKTSEAGGVSIDVRPMNFAFDKPLRFELIFNTHQGNLDFDLKKQSFLIDGQNNKYLPLEWEGESGGHHLLGELVFPALARETRTMKLVINDVYGIKERIFEWNLE